MRKVCTLKHLATALVPAMVMAAASISLAQEERQPVNLKAVCVLHAVGDSGVSGTVTFVQKGARTMITAELSGLTPGKHGFHVHEFGDITSLDGGSAGGHFNPEGTPHGGPDSAERHVGDLGNIVADANGKATYSRRDRVVKLRGPNSVVGRAIVVHAGTDDLTTQPTGDAGARAAYGVIGLAKPEE